MFLKAKSVSRSILTVLAAAGITYILIWQSKSGMVLSIVATAMVLVVLASAAAIVYFVQRFLDGQVRTWASVTSAVLIAIAFVVAVTAVIESHKLPNVYRHVLDSDPNRDDDF